MEYVKENDAIECLSAIILCQEFHPNRTLQRLDNIGVCVVVKCKRGAQAEIKKELNPREPIVNKNSNVVLGDSLNGESIVLYLNQKRKPDYLLGANSHRHKGHHYVSKVFTYAYIDRKWHNIKQIYDQRQLG